jgi:NDP-sugar pyrophosphorylase family protein
MSDEPPPLAVILAGGLGTRIRHVLPNLPKVLAPAAGRPFLEWLLCYLHLQGIRRAVLSTGYLGEHIDDFAQQLQIPELAVSCVRERAPLGTAGAVVHALSEQPDTASDVLVCNGDSLALAELSELRDALDVSGSAAAMLAVRVQEARHFGTVAMGAGGALVGFAEKRPGAGLVNAGVYLLRRAALARFPPNRPLSFEFDVFPALIGAGIRVQVVASDCPFLDIGREDTLVQADAFVAANNAWFQ